MSRGKCGAVARKALELPVPCMGGEARFQN